MKKFIISTISALTFLSPFFVNSENIKSPLYDNSHERDGEITHIVLHFASNVVINPNDPYIIDEIRETFLENNVSIHYFIARDGTVYEEVPENRAAWHAGKGKLADEPQYTNKLNNYSIGIELLGIGSFDDMKMYISEDEYNALPPNLIGFTDEQYVSLNGLLEDIFTRNPYISPDRKHVIGHSEYAPDRRTDPGELFDWSRLDFE